MPFFPIPLDSPFIKTTLILGYFIGAINLLMFAHSVRIARHRDRFECKMCGNCCRLRIISLTDEDIKRLSEHGHTDFYVKKGNEYWMKRVKGRCIFLKDDLCSIYEIRPEICRNFPFFKMYGITYCRRLSYCPALEELEKEIKIL